MTLEVRIPSSHLSERTWIVEALVGRFTSDFVIIPEDRDDWLISVSEMSGGINFKDSLIPGFYEDKMRNLAPPIFWKHGCPLLAERYLPVINFETTNNQLFLQTHSNYLYCGVDLFGMAFWAMSRWEEINSCHHMDEFNRFPAVSSYLYKYGILCRPWVDEWVVWLKYQIRKIWPHLDLKNKCGEMILSHDVDFPYLYAFDQVSDLIRRIGGDIFRRKNIMSALRAPLLWGMVKAGHIKIDPYNSFDWIMQQSEKKGLKSTFYFIAGNSAGKIDGNYSINHPLIRQLLRSISNRGHRIGLHPSFNSYLNGGILSQELQALMMVCEEEGIKQDEWISRQHYLRWKTPTTALALEAAGIAGDSTLGFAECSGFRCGTCYEFDFFDVNLGTQLNLKVLPLIVMDISILGYQKLGYEESVSRINTLKTKCFEVGGKFTLLWHNTSLVQEMHRNLYLKVVN
ncbi:hypothetical protein G6656_09035 [Polynucleobacter paneuropaeus]|nr:hypothetical protein [Polynucleobacter paneuropaeus]